MEAKCEEGCAKVTLTGGADAVTWSKMTDSEANAIYNLP